MACFGGAFYCAERFFAKSFAPNEIFKLTPSPRGVGGGSREVRGGLLCADQIHHSKELMRDRRTDFVFGADRSKHVTGISHPAFWFCVKCIPHCVICVFGSFSQLNTFRTVERRCAEAHIFAFLIEPPRLHLFRDVFRKSRHCSGCLRAQLNTRCNEFARESGGNIFEPMFWTLS